MFIQRPLIRIDIEELGEAISEPCLQNNDNQQTPEVTTPISSEEQKNNEEVYVIPTTSNSSENSIDMMIPSVPTKSEQVGIRGLDMVPCVPTSSIQFQSHWRSLQGNDTSLVTYFKVCVCLFLSTCRSVHSSIYLCNHCNVISLHLAIGNSLIQISLTAEPIARN